MRANGIPRSQEDDIAHEDFVFEGGAIVAFWLAQSSLDLSADAGNCSDACAFEFGNLESRVEHITDEGCIAEDFVGTACKFELLHYLCSFIDIQYYSGGCNTKVGVLVRERLNAAETGIWRDEWAIESAEEMHVLRGT